MKIAMCGMAAVMLVAGCSKKEDVVETTAAGTAAQEETEAESETAAREDIDNGKVTSLGQYKGVEVTKISTEVTDEELDAYIQSVLAANPEYIEITDRAAQDGDIVNIDFVGMKDGVAFEGGTSEGYDLELGSDSFIDGFEDGLIGAAVGEERSLNLTFPENYGSADLAGQDVVFDVTVNSIQEVKEAQLNDDFVKRISDFTTVDEYKADVLANMKEEFEMLAEQQLEKDALMAAVSNSEYELNQEAVDYQYENQLSYYTSMLQMYGMDLATYVSMYGMTEEQFKEELKTAAEEAVKQQLLIEAVAESENLQVEDADREVIAADMGAEVQALVDSYGQETVDETAMMYKVIKFIRDNAVVK